MRRRRSNLNRGIQIAMAILTIAAVVKELRTPREKRTWHGRILFVPYNFRPPTIQRIKDTYWNPYERHVLVPMVFGLGWTVNLYSLLENLGLIKQPSVSERDFLMPNQRMREILKA